VSRDGTEIVPVIGKVLRGTNARRLLYYLYGLGKANEVFSARMNPTKIA